MEESLPRGHRDNNQQSQYCHKKKLAHQHHLLTDHTMHISGIRVSPLHYAGVHWPTAYSACSHEPFKQTQDSSLNNMLWNTARFSSETS